jgi:hypothetical protein
VSGDDFLSRWSRRKRASKAAQDRPTADALHEASGIPSASIESESALPAKAQARAEADPKPLPPVESLTPESDFTPFMGRDVDPAIRRGALKALFRDPRHNVMDGLDVYIDDYSKPDPLPEGWLEKMNQVARLGIFRPQEPVAEGEAADPAGAEEVPAALAEAPGDGVAPPASYDTSEAVESPPEVPKS